MVLAGRLLSDGIDMAVPGTSCTPDIQVWGLLSRCCTDRPASQINGKLRGTVEVFKTIGQEDALVAGTALDTVARQMEGKTVRKVIFVPGKILNIIVG